MAPSNINSAAERQPEIRSADGLDEEPVTIAMIADQCGLSKAAVSYALRGKRGVSEKTRFEVERVARRLGWEPHPPRRRRPTAGLQSLGLLVPQPIEVLTEESFTAQFISGLKAKLSERGASLVLDFEVDQRVQMDIYRAWMDMDVTSVVLMEVVPDDFRLTYLFRLGLSAVSTCPPVSPDVVQCIYTDDAADMTSLLARLFADGHRRMLHVSGPSAHPQVVRRQLAWRSFFEDHAELQQDTITTDWVARSSYATIEASLASQHPDAIIFDSDRLALLGLRATQRLGVDLRRSLSLISFDDSLLCKAVGLASLDRDARELGRRTAHVALDESVQTAEPSKFVLPVASLKRRGTYRPTHRHHG